MKHFKLLINSACCLLVACGCHKAATPKEASEAEYNNGDYHIRFTYPAAWHLMEDNDQDSLHVTLTAKAYSIEIYSRKSLDLMFGTMEDNFNNFMEFESQSSASYVFTGTKPSVLTNLPGYEFSFTMKQQQLEGVGFYTTKFNYNYAVLFQSDRITDQLYHQMLAFVTNMALTPPDPLAGNMPLVKLYGVTTITNRSEMVNALEYGRQLLQNRELDARYYNMAKQQFYIVLLSLTKSNAHLRLYQDAWTLLQVADNMQIEAEQRHTFDMERNVAMERYEDALRNAQYLMLLYPEHTKQHKDAQQQFYTIKNKMN